MYLQVVHLPWLRVRCSGYADIYTWSPEPPTHFHYTWGSSISIKLSQQPATQSKLHVTKKNVVGHQWWLVPNLFNLRLPKPCSLSCITGLCSCKGDAGGYGKALSCCFPSSSPPLRLSNAPVAPDSGGRVCLTLTHKLKVNYESGRSFGLLEG